MQDITPADSVVPVYLVPLTEEEIVEREQLTAEALENDKAEEAKIAAKETAKAKLASLGLAEEEVLAIIGG